MLCQEEREPICLDPTDELEAMMSLAGPASAGAAANGNGTQARAGVPFAGLYGDGAPAREPSLQERLSQRLVRAFIGEPNTAPNPTKAEPGQEVKASYEGAAYRALGLDEEQFATMDPIQRNNRINAAYARMYLSEPETYKWAGMAAMASDKAGTGMLQTYMLELGAEAPAGAGVERAIGAPEGSEVRRLLAKGNAGIFNDMYWQHLAFQKGGVEELEKAAEEGSITAEHLEGWRQLAEAKQALAEARGAGNHEAIARAQQGIWGANKTLLHGEQKHVQNVAYAESDQSRDAFRFLSGNWNVLGVDSPIPGGTNFDDHRDDKPGTDDVGDFDQRWGWIDQHMLPEYVAFEGSDRMTPRMMELVAQEQTHPWIHKVLGAVGRR